MGDDVIKNYDKIPIIVPSLNPDEKLLCVINGLVSVGFSDIIIVNDGSDDEHLRYFEDVGKFSECTILRHEKNKGKGAALKTAFSYIIENRKDCIGVITADGDNQHQPNDIAACADAMIEKKDNVILGVRDFSLPEVPFRSKFGNKLTSFIFKTSCGLNISDTQTGLRAIPFEYLDKFIKTQGDRFEYETNMLLDMKTYSIPFSEVKISTLYIEGNESSHFNPIVDSIKIYKTILKFIASSIFSSLLDLLLFFVLQFIFTDMVKLCTVIARIISSLVNFFTNKKVVFGCKKGIGKTFLRYYALSIPLMIVSAYSVEYVTSLLSLENKLVITIIKMIIDTILFFVSYKIQRSWVFGTGKKNTEAKQRKEQP